MRKNFGKQTYVYPMPVFIIGTYDENGNANAMNAAWGGIHDDYQIAICVAPNHKTAKNLLIKKAFPRITSVKTSQTVLKTVSIEFLVVDVTFLAKSADKPTSTTPIVFLFWS